MNDLNKVLEEVVLYLASHPSERLLNLQVGAKIIPVYVPKRTTGSIGND